MLNELLQVSGCDHVVLAVRADPVALPLDTLTTLVLIAMEAATNSIKHVFSKAAGRRLDVTLRRSGNELELAIADDGPGLPDRGSAGRPSGLGLSILESLASQIGGELYVQSGSGTVVRVVFPLMRGRQRAASDAAAAGGGSPQRDNVAAIAGTHREGMPAWAGGGMRSVPPYDG